MKLLLSITTKTEGSVNLNKMFLIFDTDNKGYRFLKFNGDVRGSANGNRGMGMCYHNQFWYAGVFCVEHRVGSKILAIDLETGEQRINKLQMTKAIHSVRSYGDCGPYNMILANSTQNDCITILTMNGTQLVTEDVFFDFLSNKARIKLDWSKEYIYDDLLHVNDCIKHNGDLYAVMFYNYKDYDKDHEEMIEKRERIKNLSDDQKRDWINNQKKLDWRKQVKEWKGAIYDLTRDKLLVKTSQPHSLIIDQFENRVFCESWSYKLINITQKKEVQCKGFTRGLCEDKERGGYWVGSSYHRVFSNLLPGAALEFVNYDMEVESTIDMSKFGLEIYDIIPFKEGEWLL